MNDFNVYDYMKILRKRVRERKITTKQYRKLLGLLLQWEANKVNILGFDQW